MLAVLQPPDLYQGKEDHMLKDEPKIGTSIPLVGALLTTFCFGGWAWFWSVIWPPSRLQIAAAIGGICFGLIYCVDRLRNWDVYTWEWRPATRNRTYTPIIYRLAILGGPLGILATQIAREFISKEVRYAFVSAGLAGMGLVFVWTVVECCRHLLYYRTKL